MSKNITNYDRMFTYCWYEKTDPNKCKFGERWVLAGQDPEEEVWIRIKQSVGVRKDLIRSNMIDLCAYWDVTELSKSVNRYYKQSRMDDYIRPYIGHRSGSTGEIHDLSPDKLILKVNEFLKKTVQPLPVVGLSQWQLDAAENVIAAIANGDRTIMAELCARFGKTIWAGVLAVETGSKVTIVASYVLTSFASFAKDLTEFEQFRNLAVIDSASANYQDEVNAALEEGRQVIVFLSMCGGGKRQNRINFLFGLPQQRLVFIDEADFGAHTSKQADPFITARDNNDVIVLMTGTNGERACGNWSIDHYLGTTYAELLMERAGV